MNTLLEDWRRFIRNGFRAEDFTEAIYRHLVTAGGFTHDGDKADFWSTYFDEGLSWLIAFVEQFGGSLEGVETMGDDWIDLAPDINRALVEEMQLIYPALVDVLLAQEDAIYDEYKAFNLANIEAGDGGWTTAQRAVASQSYDQDFYYYGGYEIFDYDGVNDDLRDRLAAAVAAYVTPNAVATLFEAARSVKSAPAPRSAQKTLFTARRTRGLNHHRLAEATPQRQVVPVPAITAVTPADVAQYLTLRAAG